MVGVRAWESTGVETTAEMFLAIIAPLFVQHILKGTFYPGKDFKTGFDVEAMGKLQAELTGFVGLDVRGCHFRQQDMYEAVKAASQTDDAKDVFNGWHSAKGFETTEVCLQVVAYSYRCLCAHFRENLKKDFAVWATMPRPLAIQIGSRT
eukprot:7693117-Pyramimonas_sp.AAC.1